MKRAIVGLLLVISLAFRMPIFSAEEQRRVYCRQLGDSKRIALTFDDGPHPRYTKEILEILKEYGVTATFFVIGVNAENYPQALRELADSGCEIGNHTYSHTRLTQMSEDDIKNEIQRCEEILMKSVGVKPCVFRPPEGMYPKESERIIEEMGYDIILWSIDTKDWARTPSHQIEQMVLSRTKGGDIILMHDYVSGGNTTCPALRNLIPRLLAQGYEFVTVSELIGK